MGLFRKSLEDKVQNAVERVRAQFPESSITAQVDNDVVTLTGRTSDLDTKTRIMAAFNEAVETKNTINQISIEQKPSQSTAKGIGASRPATATPGVTLATESRTHEVVAGDTLSGLAQRYYGDGSQFRKIFDANRDQLNDPDKIRIGQRLKIPL